MADDLEALFRAIGTRLEELGPGDEGDAGLAENVHGRWCQG